MHPKGQTAMEYMLILAIVLAVVIAVMMYLQSSSQAGQKSASCNINSMLCSQEVCGSEADCRSGDAAKFCGSAATCGPMGKCIAACE